MPLFQTRSIIQCLVAWWEKVLFYHQEIVEYSNIEVKIRWRNNLFQFIKWSHMCTNVLMNGGVITLFVILKNICNDPDKTQTASTSYYNYIFNNHFLKLFVVSSLVIIHQTWVIWSYRHGHIIIKVYQDCHLIKLVPPLITNYNFNSITLYLSPCVPSPITHVTFRSALLCLLRQVLNGVVIHEQLTPKKKI